MKRLISVLLIVGQVLIGIPTRVLAADTGKPSGPPPPPKVKVNRTLPDVTPFDPKLRFPEMPSDSDIFRARVFEEPLVPIGGSEDAAENRALADALLVHHARSGKHDVAAIMKFLEAHPQSRWRPALQLNLGISYYWAGYFSKALATWEEVWQAARHDQTAHGRAIADRAIGEIAAMNARVGRKSVLEALFADLGDRNVRGPATEKLHAAREGLEAMNTRPQDSFKCGPYALDRIRASRDPKDAFHPKILAARSTDKGLSLAEVQALASELKMGYRMAKRAPGATVIVPSVAHWKIGHFGALVREGEGRYLIQDPTFGDDIWTTPEALDEEGSGYFLVPQGPLPAGWAAVSTSEGGTVFGKGHLSSKDPKATRPCDGKAKDGDGPCGDGGGGGMAVWNVHSLLVSLNIVDTPVGYTPPVGPAVYFTATYNQREAGQPSIFTYSNLGQKWTHNWLAFIMDDPTNPEGNVTSGVAGGGAELHTAYNPLTQTFAPHPETQSTLRRDSGGSNPRYEMMQPDGSKLVYAQDDGASSFPRKIFLSEVVDPQGNKVTLTYDSQLRLVAIRDAINQVTILSYGLAGDPLKITRVTDPFGRFAEFRYNNAQPRQLVEIEDVIGIKSQFAYGDSDVMSALTTPYGTTRFFATAYETRYNWIDIVDPLGQRERVQWTDFHTGTDESPNTVPTGIDPELLHLYDSVTYYWNKGALANSTSTVDVDKAAITTWVTGSGANARVAMGIKATQKKPLENRVFYGYDGQASPVLAGNASLPNRISRVLSFDPATNTKSEEVHAYEYNAAGKVTRYTDPVGRETVYEYENDIDLTAIKQKNGATHDVLWRATYNTQHLPLTITDASNQTTVLTYNARGQLETVTTPQRAGVTENRVTTLTYDADGYLQSVVGPVSSAMLSVGYDGYGRPRTLTNADSYAVTLDYDALDRPTKAYYPNGTYEDVEWDRLDVRKYRNVAGQATEILHDALRRPTVVRDPSGRTANLVWCGCGGLERIVDGNGNATSFERDIQGRVTREVRADGSVVAATFDAVSRVVSVGDGRVVRKYAYNTDGTLLRSDYADPATNLPDPDTPSVSFAYGSVYRHLAARTDRTGTTTYTYHPANGVLGAGRLSAIDGPLANDLISYEYDELGRARRRLIDGVPASVAYDSLGRVSNVTNALGAFEYSFDGSTSRLLGVTGPNGLTRNYEYFDNGGDRQLKQITNSVGGSLLSRFGYTYAADNEIASWTQETGESSSAQRYTLSYDGASQLTSALLSRMSDGQILKSFAYSYDKASNRTTEQIDAVATRATHNSGNQVTSVQAGGVMAFGGVANEPSKVTVNGRAAQVGPGGGFRADVPVASGTSTVPVVVADVSGNTRTYTYEVSVSGGDAALTYDSSGNLIADGARTYEWDLLNRLLAINEGAKRSEFEYDGLSRRARIIEKDGGVIVSDKRYLWAGTQIVEERDASGANALKRYFGQGVEQAGQDLFYTRDHLGSIREVVASSGVVRARYDYDPYGRRTKVSGDLDADFGFTGHFHHAQSNLNLALNRAYNASVGRWLSRDPIGLNGGINLYAYVANDPINYVDPLGLSPETFAQGAAGAAAGVAVGAAIAAGALAAAAGTAAAPAVATALAVVGIWSASWALGELIASGLYGDIDEVDNRAGAMCVIGAAGLVGGLKARGIPRSVNDAIATGQVKSSGNLTNILRGMERGHKRANPRNSEEAMGVVAEAAEGAGLETGVPTQTPDGGLSFTNRGGVVTKMGPDGSITVTKGSTTILGLCSRR